jgi:hypothetical protein
MMAVVRFLVRYSTFFLCCLVADIFFAVMGYPAFGRYSGVPFVLGAELTLLAGMAIAMSISGFRSEKTFLERLLSGVQPLLMLIVIVLGFDRVFEDQRLRFLFAIKSDLSLLRDPYFAVDARSRELLQACGPVGNAAHDHFTLTGDVFFFDVRCVDGKTHKLIISANFGRFEYENRYSVRVLERRDL